MDKTTILCYTQFRQNIESSIGGHFMSKLYNSFTEVATNLSNYFTNSSNNISLLQARNLAYCTIGAIQANSIITSKISVNFKGFLSQNKPDSNIKRVKRFFNNSKFNMNHF